LVVGSAFWIAAPEIVNLLFQRGRFTAENSIAVSSVLRFLLLQLPFYTVGLLYSSALASKGQYRDLFATSVIAILVKVALITALGDSLGIHGIALSTTGMYCATTLYMAVRILQWRSAPTSNQR
jgi:peptidoglycan biosynthesis protein MviN/MurJ (putative lipid II flippase)